MEYCISEIWRVAAKAPLDEADRIRLAEREWSIAAEHKMRWVDSVGLDGSARIGWLETDCVVIDRSQIVAERLFQATRKLRIGIELPLHAHLQQRGIAAEMRAADPQRRISIEQAAKYHMKDIERGVEQIAADDRQLVLAMRSRAGGLDGCTITGTSRFVAALKMDANSAESR